MVSVFTKIINGEFPARFVWEDENCVAFLSIGPVAMGHVLVVPRKEVDKWFDLDLSTWQALNRVAHVVAKAIQRAFNAPRVGMLIAGFEVPHTHIHLFPALDMSGFDLSTAQSNPDSKEMDEAAEKIRDALVSIITEE